MIAGWCDSCEIADRWMNLIDDMSAFVQVMVPLLDSVLIQLCVTKGRRYATAS